MDEEGNPTLFHSVSVGTLRIPTSVSSLCSEDNNCDAQPLDAVTWRGGFDICNQEGNREILGLKAHLSNKACPKVCDLALKIPKLLSVEMVPRLNTWPKRFSESPPTGENIAIYIFPEDESHAQVFNNLVDKIICGDLALKSFVDGSNLLLFTSLQLPMQHRRFQGKIYVWGVFKGKSASASYQSNNQISVLSACTNSVALAILSNDTCDEDRTNTSGANDGVPIPTKEINIDLWEHGRSAGEGKPGVICNYCNHVYAGRGGIARFEKHLAGGYRKWYVKRCLKVPKEVEDAMKETLEAKAIVKMNKLVEIGVSDELKGMEAKTINPKYMKQQNIYSNKNNTKKLQKQKFCYWKRSIGCVLRSGVTRSETGGNHRSKKRKSSVLETRLSESVRALQLKETVPCSSSVSPDQGPSGGARRTRVKPQCKCCVTPETPPKKRNRSILSGGGASAKTTLGKESSNKKEHRRENVESEVRPVSGKQKKKVVKKAIKGRRRGISARSSTSNLLEEGGNAMDLIQQNPERAPENTPNSACTPVTASRLSVPNIQLEEVSAQNVGEASQFETTSVPQGDQNNPPLPLILVQQHPEEVAEPQIAAPENIPNPTSTHVVASSLAAPDVQLEEILLAPSTVSAENVKDKRRQVGSTSVVPQGDHLRSLSTNYELSDQSTDLSFLGIVNAANELAESDCTDSGHASVMQVGQYTVKHNLGQTLQAIFEKYGDIAQSSTLQSSFVRSHFLGGLCEVLNELEDIQLPGLRRHHLQSLLAAVTTAESVGLDVSWLHQRYDDLKTTLEGIKKYSALQNELAKAKAVAESRKKSLDSKKAEMMKLQREMETLNGQVDSLRAEQEELESKMSNVCLKAKRFRHKNLAHGLL